METRKLLAASLLGLGLTLGLVWLLGANLAAAAPTAVFSVTKFTDSADGTCDGDCSLREAIIAANGNAQDDTIVLGTGTYALSLTAGATDPVTGDLDITGGYALTITGNGPKNTVIDAGGIDRVIEIEYLSPTVVISGVTIVGGATTGDGGGIYVHHGDLDLTLINVTVYSNSATYGGGLAVVDGAGVTLSDGRIVSNTADWGGGVYVDEGSSATLNGGQIVSNTATWGGGAYVYDGSATLSGGQIVSNTASALGGGVCVGYGSVTLSGGQIVNNTAPYGGGVYVGFGSATISDGLIAGNVATGTTYSRGGGVYVSYGSVTLGGGQIASNTADQGGGVFVRSGSATLNGGQILSNTANYKGGGVYVSLSTATFTQTGGLIAHNVVTGTGTWDGGGVYVYDGSATLSGGQIVSNTASFGGGVYVSSGRATLSGGQILSNTAGESGGGVCLYHDGAAFTQTAGLIAYNTAEGTDAADGGGGIYSRYSSNQVTLSGGQVLGNQADRGGGLYIRLGSVTMLGGQIVDNDAAYGGGVYAGAVGWSVPLEGGQIISNTASKNGGGLYAAAGSVTMERGQIIDNRADFEGGGVFHKDGVLTLINTTVSGNDADDGGGLYNAGGTIVLTHTTVVSNRNGAGGRGIGVATPGSVLAKNTIVAYNTQGDCESGAVTSNDHNLDSDGTCGLAQSNDKSGVDPQLAPLAYDRGTMVHAITQSSPAYNAGACQAGITTDQRGLPRLTPCDMGAYEYVHTQVHLPLVLRDYP